MIHHAGRGMAFSDGPRRERRRDGHAVADVAQPGAGDRYVDGDQQGVVARLGGPVDQRHRAVPVLPHVELEPVPAVRVRRGDVLDGRRAHRGERERDPGRGGRAGARDLALGLHHPGEAGRRDAERQGDPAPQHLAGGVHARDVAKDRRVELDVRERLAGAGQRHLAVGRARRCSRTRPSAYAASRSAQVVDRQRVLEPPLLGGQLGFLNFISGARSRRLGSLSLHPGDSPEETQRWSGGSRTAGCRGYAGRARASQQGRGGRRRDGGPAPARCPARTPRPVRQARVRRRRRRSVGRGGRCARPPPTTCTTSTSRPASRAACRTCRR